MMILPSGKLGDFNQGFMLLGRRPECDQVLMEIEAGQLFGTKSGPSIMILPFVVFSSVAL